MYSIPLGSLRLDFDAAIIEVPRNGDYDWMNSEWIDVRQEIEIVQREMSATVVGMTGRFAQKGPHVIEILSPFIFTEREVVDHLLTKAMTSGLNGNVAQESVHAMDFSWGTLVSLNWSELGYAPGGTEYCLLPNDGPAISIGHLRLDWTSVRFREIV